MKEICVEISDRYEIIFSEIGADEHYVHVLVQSITLFIDNIIRTIKSITARQVFKKFSSIKKQLWGGGCWTSGYYADTVG